MTYADVTIKQFIEVKNLLAQLNGSITDVIIHQKVYTELTGISQDEIDLWTVEQWNERKKEIEFLSKDAKVEKLTSSIKINGVKFHRILNARKIPFGKYIDVMTEAQSDPEKIDNMHNIMALLLENKMDYEERAEFLYNHMTMNHVFPHMLFFSKVFRALIDSLPDYLSKELSKILSQTKDLATSISTGDGL